VPITTAVENVSAVTVASGPPQQHPLLHAKLLKQWVSLRRQACPSTNEVNDHSLILKRVSLILQKVVFE
jgi:hypothetical protein